MISARFAPEEEELVRRAAAERGESVSRFVRGVGSPGSAATHRTDANEAHGGIVAGASEDLDRRIRSGS
jgi:hypothetical protein